MHIFCNIIQLDIHIYIYIYIHIYIYKYAVDTCTTVCVCIDIDVLPVLYIQVPSSCQYENQPPWSPGISSSCWSFSSTLGLQTSDAIFFWAATWIKAPEVWTPPASYFSTRRFLGDDLRKNLETSPILTFWVVETEDSLVLMARIFWNSGFLTVWLDCPVQHHRCHCDRDIFRTAGWRFHSLSSLILRMVLRNDFQMRSTTNHIFISRPIDSFPCLERHSSRRIYCCCAVTMRISDQIRGGVVRRAWDLKWSTVN